MPSAHSEAVIKYYDTHPINEFEILEKLKAKGVDLDNLTVEQLSEFDQDHYDATRAVDILINRTGISSKHHVLDVCSGVGGPARWIAHRVGCRVTGLDLTKSRVETAKKLTALTKLSHLVDFVEGNATEMPLPAETYDVIIIQEALVHIKDKSTVFAECVRVAKPGAIIAFTDLTAQIPFDREQQDLLTWAILSAETLTSKDYIGLLKSHGCEIQHCEDLSVQWKDLLVKRLAMYRSLRDTTVAKFGEKHFQDWDKRYSYFVGLLTAGLLGGTRLVARIKAKLIKPIVEVAITDTSASSNSELPAEQHVPHPQQTKEFTPALSGVVASMLTNAGEISVTHVPNASAAIMKAKL